MANDVKIEISAKFEEGGAPSIKSIVKEIDKVYKNPNKNEKYVIDILKILGTQTPGETTSDKILKIAKQLNFEGYKYLEKVTGKKNLTANDLDFFINKIAMSYYSPALRIKEFRRVFDPYFKILGKGVKNDSLDVIFATEHFPKYSSSVIAPLGYWLIGFMNSFSVFTDVLNNLSQSLKTEQIYLNLTPSGMTFEKKLFKEAEFKFEYGGNAKNADNTGIKFSMK
jgi:hypothetical protein